MNYQQQAVAGMNPVELIVALYDGMVRFLYQAIAATEHRESEGRRTAIARVLEILMHLQSRLRTDVGGNSAKALSEFYTAIFALCGGIAAGVAGPLQGSDGVHSRCTRGMERCSTRRGSSAVAERRRPRCGPNDINDSNERARGRADELELDGITGSMGDGELFFEQLFLEQPCIVAIQFEQFLVRSQFRYAAPHQHGDAIGVADG